jgi:hypothetical protein
MTKVIFDMPKGKKTVKLTDVKSQQDLKDLLSDVIVKKQEKRNEPSRTS